MEDKKIEIPVHEPDISVLDIITDDIELPTVPAEPFGGEDDGSIQSLVH